MWEEKIVSRSHKRRGVSFAFVAVGIVMLLGMAALTVDVGMIYRARAESQASADAAAMAGAWELLDRDRLSGDGNMTEELAAARAEAIQTAARNLVINEGPDVDANSGNGSGGDLVVGYLEDPNDPDAALTFTNPNEYNTVVVRVRRDAVRNGPIDLFFAPVFGHLTSEVSAEAWATFKDGVVGYQPTDQTGNADLLPFALHRNSWQNLLDGVFTAGDNYTYNSATGAVSAGADGIPELNLYPGGGAGQLPPGNFGTVDIGPSNNSTADLSRQIRYGVSQEDLEVFGGELVLGADGTLELNGDTGLSAGVKDDLEAIKGQPRAIPIFSAVSGNGNNSMYTIVGFVGIRIMYVKLTGSQSSKKVLIQPAYVVDDSVITDAGSGPSYFVYKPVYISR